MKKQQQTDVSDEHTNSASLLSFPLPFQPQQRFRHRHVRSTMVVFKKTTTIVPPAHTQPGITTHVSATIEHNARRPHTPRHIDFQIVFAYFDTE